MCSSLWPCALQHPRLPCPSLSPRVCSNSCPSSRWCHPTLSSSVAPFSSYLSLSQHQGPFQWVSSLYQVARVVKFQVQHEYSGLIPFRIDWFDLLAVQGTLKSLYSTTVRKHQFFSTQLSLLSNSHIHTWLTGKTIALPICSFVGRVMSLLFNTLSKFVIAFLPRSKHCLISWRQSPSTVIFVAQENKVCYCFHCFPVYLPWSDGTRYHDLISFLNVEF